MRRSALGSILTIVYIVVGVVVANDRHYFVHLDAVKTIVSAILAVVLWPLLFLGVSLHIH